MEIVTTFPESLVCDGNCDEYDCFDEANCGGYRYGVFCKKLYGETEINWYFPPRDICDGRDHCMDGEDEANCDIKNTTINTCIHIDTKKVVPIFNFTRCPEVKRGIAAIHYLSRYCEEYIWYQSNCTDPSKVAGECNINGYKSTISIFMLCRGKKGCDDNLEDICLQTSSTCFLHKHFTCDSKVNCADRSDETDLSCRTKTFQRCKRRAGRMEMLPIPLTWLKDGFQDCVDGEDEEDIWPTCGIGKSLRFVVDNKTCQNVYICPRSKPGYVELSDLCDGIETCGNENKVCSEARESETLFKNVFTTNKGLTKHMSYCMKGIKGSQNFNGACHKLTFIFPDHNYFGVNTKTTLILPKRKQNCDNMYGEQYVLTSSQVARTNASTLSVL